MTRSNTHRRFNNFYEAVKAIVVVFICGLFFLIPMETHAWDPDAYNSGKSLGAEMDAKLNTTDGITERISNPMTSDSSSMRTMDDRLVFGSQIQAPSSNAFLEVLIQPSGTGDITSLNIRQDTNFDGNPDYGYRVSSPLSGICSNGFISADVGTWNRKRYYVWQADSRGRLTAAQAPSMLSLAGCYCINSSCGSNLVWNNISIVLRDIGGGMVSAIQQQMPFTITNVDILQTEIKYYGQASNRMGNTAGVPESGVSDPERYFDDGRGELPGDQEALRQSRDPDSLYSQLNALGNTIGNEYETRRCDIRRQVQLNPQTEIIGYDVNFYVGYDANGSSKECFWANDSGACKDVWNQGGGWVQCRATNIDNLGTIVHSIIDSGACIPYTDPVSGQSGCFSPPGTINVRSYEFVRQADSGTTPGCYGSGDDRTHEIWRVKAYVVDHPESYQQTTTGQLILGVTDVPRITRTGSCGTMDLNGCHKFDEKICDHTDSGCVYTYLNYNATGLIPVSGCFSEVSPSTGAVWTFCADGSRITYQSGSNQGILESGTDVWWNIHCTYTCDAGSLYDFNNAQMRTANIQNTLNPGTATLAYQDLNPQTGRRTRYTTAIPPREDVPHCEASCRVKILVQDTQAALSGTTDDYRTTVNSYEFAIRKCVNNVCPIGRGEILVQNCGCTSYFNEAASMLQVVQDAGKDLICSRD